MIRHFGPPLLAAVLLAAPARADAPPLEPGEALTIEHAVALALEYHPALLAARARADASRERVGVARADLLPQIWGAAQYLRATNNGIGSTAFLGTDGVPRAPTEGNGVGTNQLGLSDTFNNYLGGLGAYQFLLDFGRRRGLVTQRDAEAEAEAARSRLVQLDLVYTVTAAYADLAAAREVVTVYDRAVAQRHDQRSRAAVRARADLAPQADVYTADAELARADLDLVEAQNAVAVGQVRLNNAMGLGSRAPTYTLAEGLDAAAPSDELPAYLARAMAQRPDLQLFEEQARAAGAVITQAESDYWPTVGAVGGLNARGQGDQPAANYYAGISLIWPLFNGLATDHEVAEARLQQEAVRHDIENLRLDIAQQVEQSYLDCRAAAERIQRAQRAVDAASLQLDLAEHRYGAGLGSIIDVVEADRQSTGAAALLVRARADLVTARAALVRNSGEAPPGSR